MRSFLMLNNMSHKTTVAKLTQYQKKEKKFCALRKKY